MEKLNILAKHLSLRIGNLYVPILVKFKTVPSKILLIVTSFCFEKKNVYMYYALTGII